jgi:hypothetical protein
MRGLEGTNPWLREAEGMDRRLGHSLCAPCVLVVKNPCFYHRGHRDHRD